MTAPRTPCLLPRPSLSCPFRLDQHPADDDGDALAQLLRGLVPLVAGRSRAVCQKHLTHEPQPGAGLESPAPDCRLHLYSPSGCSTRRCFSNSFEPVITQLHLYPVMSPQVSTE